MEPLSDTQNYYWGSKNLCIDRSWAVVKSTAIILLNKNINKTTAQDTLSYSLINTFLFLVVDDN